MNKPYYIEGLGQGAGGSEELDALWQSFKRSGRIEDYLLYTRMRETVRKAPPQSGAQGAEL